MGLLEKLKRADINQGIEEWKNTEGAVLLDVRSREEYEQCHIDGSVNIPLDEIDKAETAIIDKGAPLFVHCLSGARSNSAVRYLQAHGFSQVRNIGGINGYKGELK